MKKFQKVESRVRQNLQSQNSKDDLKPVIERKGSARGTNSDGNVIFGRTYRRTNSFAEQKSTLNKQALEKLNHQKNPEVGGNNENVAPNHGLPPRTPNYGKTPKYIEKFKEEARVKEEEKAEMRAAKMRPAGTKVLPEAERIKTLEDLKKNKETVNKLL